MDRATQGGGLIIWRAKCTTTDWIWHGFSLLRLGGILQAKRLRNTLRHFSGTPDLCLTHTHTHTHGRSIGLYRASIASCGKIHVGLHCTVSTLRAPSSISTMYYMQCNVLIKEFVLGTCITLVYWTVLIKYAYIQCYNIICQNATL